MIAACWLGDAALAHSLRTANLNIVNHYICADRHQVAFAARANETTVVRLMLECGLSMGTGTQHRATPRHWAAFHGNIEMARALLHHGANLELKDADFDCTPLAWAIHGYLHGWNSDKGDYFGTVSVL